MRRNGFTLWELIVVMIVMVIGMVLFFKAEERVRHEPYRKMIIADLQEIAKAHAQYLEVNKQPPAQVKDLLPLLTRETARHGLERGNYIVLWQTKADRPGAVLACTMDAVRHDGMVCSTDGQVEERSAAEVQAILGAGK